MKLYNYKIDQDISIRTYEFGGIVVHDKLNGELEIEYESIPKLIAALQQIMKDKEDE